MVCSMEEEERQTDNERRHRLHLLLIVLHLKVAGQLRLSGVHGVPSVLDGGVENGASVIIVQDGG